VSGSNAPALEKSIAPYRSRPDLEWQPISAGLEDAFIRLMQEAQDRLQ
jgi:ABC-2 type transport system ATP-binding protein